MGKIIAVANQKGGVGKTTTTVNLSAALSERGKSVLVLDLDPQGHASSGLGVRDEQPEYTAYDLLIDNVPAEQATIDTPWCRIIPCNAELAGAEIELVPLERREFRLRESLAAVKDDYDFIIIDCAPSLGLLTLNALCAADSLLIPLQCEYYALEGLSRLMSTIRTVRRSMNPKLDLEGILFTMYDARTNLAIQVVEEVKKHFGERVYHTVIPRNVRLSEAPSHGQPVIVYDRYSRGADCYIALAGEFLTRNGFTV